MRRERNTQVLNNSAQEKKKPNKCQRRPIVFVERAAVKVEKKKSVVQLQTRRQKAFTKAVSTAHTDTGSVLDRSGLENTLPECRYT